jgi:hypothetical protein
MYKCRVLAYCEATVLDQVIVKFAYGFDSSWGKCPWKGPNYLHMVLSRATS